MGELREEENEVGRARNSVVLNRFPFYCGSRAEGI